LPRLLDLDRTRQRAARRLRQAVDPLGDTEERARGVRLHGGRRGEAGMTTPSYAELVAAVRREGESIVSAGKVDPDAHVVTCGDWSMRDLLAHVGRVYRRAGGLVEERSTDPADLPPEPAADVDAVAYVAEALDDLVAALGGAQAETPVWNWSDQPHVAAFWA